MPSLAAADCRTHSCLRIFNIRKLKLLFRLTSSLKPIYRQILPFLKPREFRTDQYKNIYVMNYFQKIWKQNVSYDTMFCLQICPKVWNKFYTRASSLHRKEYYRVWRKCLPKWTKSNHLEYIYNNVYTF